MSSKLRLGGFTVIEVTLVLAIAGLLAVSVLVSIGNNLSQQRYMDSTNQTIDYFSGLYDKTINVANNRANDLTCDSSGIIESPGSPKRGQGACTFVGYFVQSTDGTHLQAFSVIAKRDVSGDFDIENKPESYVLASAQLVTLDSSKADYSLEWGTRLEPSEFSVLVVRMPIGGAVRTFALTGGGSGSKAPSDLEASPIAADGLSFCLQPEGLFASGGPRNGFRIGQNASSSSSVERILGGCA